MSQSTVSLNTHTCFHIWFQAPASSQKRTTGCHDGGMTVWCLLFAVISEALSAFWPQAVMTSVLFHLTEKLWGIWDTDVWSSCGLQILSSVSDTLRFPRLKGRNRSDEPHHEHTALQRPVLYFKITSNGVFLKKGPYQCLGTVISLKTSRFSLCQTPTRVTDK